MGEIIALPPALDRLARELVSNYEYDAGYCVGEVCHPESEIVSFARWLFETGRIGGSFRVNGEKVK